MKRILLIDDDELILTLYTDVLTKAGFEVVAEKSSILALNRIMNREPFSLVITDIVMAQMDGWELLKNIREGLKINDTDLPVIVMSSYDSNEVEFQAMKRKANAWFVKPIKPISNLVKVARIWTGQSSNGGLV